MSMWKKALSVLGGVVPNLIAGNGPGWSMPFLNLLWQKHQQKPPVANNALGAAAGAAAAPTTDGPATATAQQKARPAIPQAIQVQTQGPVQTAPIDMQWLNLNPSSMDRSVTFSNPYGQKRNNQY